jgi:hypothetical protein
MANYFAVVRRKITPEGYCGDLICAQPPDEMTADKSVGAENTNLVGKLAWQEEAPKVVHAYREQPLAT